MPKQQSAAQKAKAKKGMKKKKRRDPFLRKRWAVIKVPKYMPNNEEHYRIGYTPYLKRNSKKSLEGRVFIVNLGDLQNEARKNANEDLNWKKFKFVADEVFGDKLLTNWFGMEITRDKRCSLIRKWHTMIETFVDVKTTDNHVLRVKAIAFTKRPPTSVKKNCYAKSTEVRRIREKVTEIIKKHVSETDIPGLVEKLAKSEIDNAMKDGCSRIKLLQHCLIEKIKVLRRPKKDVAKILEGHDLKVGFDKIVRQRKAEDKDDAEDSGKEDMEEDGDDEEEEEEEEPKTAA